jgi:flagellar basal body-associated protein FliL
MSEKTQIFILLTILALLVLFSALAYHFKMDIRIPGTLTQDKESADKSGRHVKCSLVSSIGSKNLILEVLIPCQDKSQQAELKKKIPKIQHALLLSTEQPLFVSSLEGRQFPEIKKHLVRIVNEISEKPVKEVFFESFFFH